MTNPPPFRRPRRWWKALGIGLGLAAVAVVALPWLIGSGPGRSRVAARINRALTPGRLEFDGLGLSWFGPTRLEKFVLRDPRGRAVASGPAATLDRTLGQWILGTSGTINLTLDGASLEVERHADGSIDLAEALRSVIASPDPKRDLDVKISGGSLSYRDPFLAEPTTADDLALDLRVRPAPDPVGWRLRLGRGDASLEIHGDYDQWLSEGGAPSTPELSIVVHGRRWPFVAKTAGVDATGALDGSLDFLRRRGRWRLSGDARVLGLRARGGPLQGDTLAFDRLDAGYDLAQGEGGEGWSIRRLALTTPVGDLKAEGQLSGPSGAGRQRIEGRLDLAALARQLPHALRLRDGLAVDRGSARLTVDAQGEPGRTTYDVEAVVSDLAARDQGRALSLRDPATLAGRLVLRGDDSSLERLSVKTAFLDASARGQLADGVELAGTLDLAGLRRQLGDWVDLGKLDLAGRAEFQGTYRFRSAGSRKNGAELAGSTIEGPVDRPEAVLKAPRFENRLDATIRDLRVEGAGPGSVRRDLATLGLSAEGPAEASGLPRGWDGANLRVESGESGLWVGLQPRGGPLGVSAVIQAPANRPGGDRKFRARLGGLLDPDRRNLAIDALTFDLLPASGRPGEAALLSTARGRLNLADGELILEAAPGTTSPAVALGPDGVRVSGLGRGLADLRVEGIFGGELDALDRLLADLSGRPPRGLAGRWSAVATARGDAEGVQLAGKVGLDETPAPGSKPVRPTSMAARAHYSTGSDRLDLSEFTVSTRYGTLDASGRLDDPTGRRAVDLKGTITPDFEAINAELARRVEPGARVDGRPRAFRASGTLDVEGQGGWLRGLDADLGFDLAGADVYGMKFGPAPVVLRARGGKLAFDPISTSINEGHIRLEPEVDLDAPGGPTLRLAKNSAIREARINDEVSRRVLAYVAPILDQATRARGLVSVDLDHAEFPIGPGRGRQAKVEGAVVFEDVEFVPGPFANELLGVINRRDSSLKLDRPVTLTIADGRINQRGMSVPLGDVTRLELAGWVDFDRNLALTATLPVTPAMLFNTPILTDIAAGTQVRLPIGGTLDHPVIDGEAFKANLQELGKSLLARGATRGAMELLMRLGRPRDPDAPPPPPRITPEERKALRQEKKAIRRGEIPPPMPE